MTEPKPTKENIELGNRIKTIRLSLGKDVRSFGAMVKPATSGSVVSRWERGINKPNAERLRSIAKLGNTTVDFLLTGDVVNLDLAEERLKKHRLEEINKNKDDGFITDLNDEQKLKLDSSLEKIKITSSLLMNNMYTEDKGINKLCLETLENIKLPISIISTILIEYLMPLSTYKVKKSDKTNFKKELEEINKILSKNSDEIMKEFTLTKTRKELKKKLPLGVDKLVTDKMLKSMLNEEWPKLKKDLNI